MNTGFKKFLFTVAVWLTCVAIGSAQDFLYLEAKVLDEHGQPMKHVSVDVKMDGIRFSLPTNEQGILSLNVAAGKAPVELQVHKSGYDKQEMRWQHAKDVPSEYVFRMQLGKPLAGVVLDAEGKAVVGAEIFSAPPDESLTFVNGRNPAKTKQTVVVTDDAGKYALPHQSAGSTIACLHDSGWAQFAKAESADSQPLEIRLKPWAQVQMLVKKRGQPSPGEAVELQYISVLAKDRGHVAWQYSGVTDEQGTFACERMTPGTVMTYRRLPQKSIAGRPTIESHSHGVLARLKSGEQTRVELGSAQQQATGQFFKPVGYDGEIDWDSGYVTLAENNQVNLLLRTAIFEYGKMLGQSGVVRPEQRVPSTLTPNYLVRYLGTIQADGSFAIDNVPPGQYTLSVVLAAHPRADRNQTDIFTIDELPCSITPAANANQTVDLGEHLLNEQSH